MSKKTMPKYFKELLDQLQKDTSNILRYYENRDCDNVAYYIVSRINDYTKSFRNMILNKLDEKILTTAFEKTMVSRENLKGILGFILAISGLLLGAILGDLSDKNLSGSLIIRLFYLKGTKPEVIGAIIFGISGFFMGFALLGNQLEKGMFNLQIKNKAFLEKYRELYILYKRRIDEVVPKTGSIDIFAKPELIKTDIRVVPEAKQDRFNLILLKIIQKECEHWMLRSDIPGDVKKKIEEWINEINHL